MRPSSSSILPSIALVAMTCSAWAGESTSPVLGPARSSDAASDEHVTYDSLMDRGIQLRRERKDQEALELFRRAYALQPTPKALAQIALAEHGVGLWLEAERDLVEALAQPDAWITQNRATLDASLTVVRKHLGRLLVTCDAPLAFVTVNGMPMGLVTAAPVRVPAGSLRVEVRAPGYVGLTKTTKVIAEETAHEDFSLAKEAAPTDQPKRPPDIARPQKPSGVAPAANSLPAPRGASRALAFGLAAGAGFLLIEAVVAHWQRERAMGRYNDDGRCVYGDLSREERCGAYRELAGTAQTLAIIGYAGSALTAIGSTVLFLNGKGDSRSVAVGPFAIRHEWRF